MKKPHVHAAAIRAYADGAQIQYRRAPDRAWVDINNPSFLSDREYRIKPVKNQALLDAYDAGKTIQARLKSPSAQWHDQNRSKDLREHIENDLFVSYDLRVKPAFPDIYDAYMAGKTIQVKCTNREDTWDDEPRGGLLERILLGMDEPVQGVAFRIKPDTYVQHSRRYVYANMAGHERVALAYKTDVKADRFVRWLDDDWLETELEGKP